MSPTKLQPESPGFIERRLNVHKDRVGDLLDRRAPEVLVGIEVSVISTLCARYARAYLYRIQQQAKRDTPPYPVL